MAPVVLVHGLSGSARWWRRNRVALATRFDVHTVDLLTLARPFRLAEAADRLTDWLDEHGLPTVSLVGHSMGAAVALDLAARSPGRVERLVLVDAAVRPVPIGQRLGGALVAGWRAPIGLVPLIAHDALRAGPLALWRATREVLALDLTDRTASVRAPTLIVWGERDTLVPVEIGRELAAALPDARLAVIRGAGHNPMWERPREFNALVLEFLTTASARPEPGVEERG